MKRILGLAIVAATLAVAQPALAKSKATVCHKGSETLSIGWPALDAHLGHGDAQGACPVVPPPEPLPIRAAVMRCDSIDGDVMVISASGSDDDILEPVPLPVEPGANCAAAIATLLNLGWDLKFVTSGSSVVVGEGESGFVTEYTFIDDPNDDVVSDAE